MAAEREILCVDLIELTKKLIESSREKGILLIKEKELVKRYF